MSKKNKKGKKETLEKLLLAVAIIDLLKSIIELLEKILN